MYKKAERLAKALYLITPAFSDTVSLKNRIDAIAVGLIDAAMLPPGNSRAALSRELLALSSVLSIAHTGNLLSPMNAELIAREAHTLLSEVALYEEPRLSLAETPTLSVLAKRALSQGIFQFQSKNQKYQTKAQKQNQYLFDPDTGERARADKGHIKDIVGVSDIRIKDRREAILSVMRNKKTASIKDLSTVIRGVSEKTIQRELSALIRKGIVLKRGERRWSTYLLV